MQMLHRSKGVYSIANMYGANHPCILGSSCYRTLLESYPLTSKQTNLAVLLVEGIPSDFPGKLELLMIFVVFLRGADVFFFLCVCFFFSVWCIFPCYLLHMLEQNMYFAEF